MAIQLGKRVAAGLGLVDSKSGQPPARAAQSAEPAGAGNARGDTMKDEWKNQFLNKLSQAQSRWLRRFEDALENAILPQFNEIKSFVCDNGFHVSTPMRELGRRSYKFELAENVYLLMIFRSLGVGEFEARCESFVPGAEPAFRKSVVRIADVDEDWAREHFQKSLDAFLDLLANETSKQPAELVAA